MGAASRLACAPASGLATGSGQTLKKMTQQEPQTQPADQATITPILTLPLKPTLMRPSICLTMLSCWITSQGRVALRLILMMCTTPQLQLGTPGPGGHSEPHPRSSCRRVRSTSTTLHVMMKLSQLHLSLLQTLFPLLMAT